MVPPQSQLFSQGKECPWGSVGQVFSFVFLLWVLRNIFLPPGQGIAPGGVTSGPAHKVKSAPLKYRTSKQPLDTQLKAVGADFGWKSKFKAKFNGCYFQKQACIVIIFSTFLRLVIIYFWFTVLMPGNCVTFILPCRITWEYSLERISHWAKVKKQDMQQAARCLPISLKYKWFPGIKDSEIHSHKVKALLSK